MSQKEQNGLSPQGQESIPKETEVKPKRTRQGLTAAYKLKILEEIDCCTESGEVGAILRRESLYSSTVSEWRKKRKEGSLSALTQQKRGPKAKEDEDSRREFRHIRNENEKLRL